MIISVKCHYLLVFIRMKDTRSKSLNALYFYEQLQSHGQLN